MSIVESKIVKKNLTKDELELYKSYRLLQTNTKAESKNVFFFIKQLHWLANKEINQTKEQGGYRDGIRYFANVAEDRLMGAERREKREGTPVPDSVKNGHDINQSILKMSNSILRVLSVLKDELEQEWTNEPIADADLNSAPTIDKQHYDGPAVPLSTVQ